MVHLQEPTIYRNAGKTRLQTLQQFYTPVGAEDQIVNRLAESPALYQLLSEAVGHIHAEFGDAAMLQLKALESDEDVLMKVVIYSALGMAEAEAALGRFDETWWLDNCHRSPSTLVFDYAVRC